MSRPLYRDLNTALRERFGCRVQKISLDAGLTCPNRDGTAGHGGCIYCNSLGSGTGRSSSQSISEQIAISKAALKRRYKADKFIAYFQSFSNTYAPKDKLHSLYHEAMSDTDVIGLSIGTRPDCINDSVLDLLSEVNQQTFLTVEYGLQSSNDNTLKLINRGHSFADFRTAVEKTRQIGIDVCVHAILGLPGESIADMLNTARVLADMDIQAIKIHLLYVVRGTPLHKMYQEERFCCLEREVYADIVAEFLALLPPSIIIHRLTGDPHPSELIAPLWALEKQHNLDAIHNAMCIKNIWQGKYYYRKTFVPLVKYRCIQHASLNSLNILTFED
jgi:hypothetical protein